MPIKLARVVVGGLCGVVVVLGVIGVAGYLTGSGSAADLCRLTGIVITGRDDALASLVGGAAQIVVAIIAAVGYAIVFEWVTRRAGALIGLLIGVAHAVFAGIAVGFLPVSALIARGIMPPGAFYEYEGIWMVAAFVAAHLSFGAIVGAIYGAVRHGPLRATRRWRDIR
jgi:hypothetical protein